MESRCAIERAIVTGTDTHTLDLAQVLVLQVKLMVQVLLRNASASVLGLPLLLNTERMSVCARR